MVDSQARSGISVSDLAAPEERSGMEPTAHLLALVAALIFGAMLATYTNMVAARRKLRNDRRRYQERIRHDHGGSKRRRQAPPDA